MYKINPVRDLNKIVNILFIDDDSSFLDSTKILLERLKYVVTSGNGSKETISLMKKYHDVFSDAFDVIISNYSMPDMNGVEFAKKASEYLIDTPIILYTGKVDLIDETKLTEAGIAKVVSKRCKISQLSSIIKEVIEKNKKV